MYRDKTLAPTEAVRLCALGILADGPTRYADLACEVRRFADRIVGPSSLDILGRSLELLRDEGLAEAENGNEGDGADAMLAITEAGRAELRTLLTSNVRAPIGDVNKLVVALFRILHLLAPAERRQQINELIELCDGELARLSELNGSAPGSEHLAAWLEHDIGQLAARIAWLEEYRGRI